MKELNSSPLFWAQIVSILDGFVALGISISLVVVSPHKAKTTNTL